MKIDILTLFPESFSYLNSSIIKRAQEGGQLEINLVDIRQFSKNKHKKCDDTPFGGGAGMLMTPQPIFDAVKSLQQPNSHIVFPSPSGQTLSPQIAQDLAKKEHLIFICGHYEGIDQRVLDLLNPQEISIGDYVLTGGELPTMVIVDCLSRFIDGVISKESLCEESFSNGSLEYPQYTRPQIFEGLAVPEVLLSGNHAQIAKWREEESKKRTQNRRPDLIKEK
ncbi:MAG: tRNA (guanosine(37)-N1)-methyltransferase TrmD [Clostridia bacterium]|nr:tRNA (guanosine(37)-N1)-methyltransferase TrmD [Clostridia bacterium]